MFARFINENGMLPCVCSQAFRYLRRVHSTVFGRCYAVSEGAANRNTKVCEVFHAFFFLVEACGML